MWEGEDGLGFFCFQAEAGIGVWRDWSSDVCSSDLVWRLYMTIQRNVLLNFIGLLL